MGGSHPPVTGSRAANTRWPTVPVMFLFSASVKGRHRPRPGEHFSYFLLMPQEELTGVFRERSLQ